MVEIIKIIAEIVNIFHDLIWETVSYFGWKATDKDLHLWVIGLIGILCYFAVHALFKMLAKWSITSISFIYTFTLLIVFVFAIEIQQKITGRGNMEFADAVIGLYGFLIFFAIYLFIRLAKKLIIKRLEKRKNRKNPPDNTSRFQG
ncbi:hypothetical protein J9303_14320 [Bacillaceae bacterium Marseille-Q3522]|nr:hypothetical protein [Bacillaceae bacterium Marseille-Q3522]